MIMERFGTFVLGSGKTITYEIVKSKRAKRSSLVMYPDGTLVARVPWYQTPLAAKRLINLKKNWIEKNYKKSLSRSKISLPNIKSSDLNKTREKAREVITERVEYFNQYYGFKYKKIFIKLKKTQWGSCSSKGNLNFNLKLIFLPMELLDYVVVHELCHLKHMNHSKKFWQEVQKLVPNYKVIEEKLGAYTLR